MNLPLMNKEKFPEDALVLLGPSIASQSPQEYYVRVQSLYEPRTSAGKVAEQLPKGKILSKPTKDLGEKTKRPMGVFEIRFTTALGLLSCTFSFPRSLELELSLVDSLGKKLNCSSQLIKTFLEKKKFIFPLDKSSPLL